MNRKKTLILFVIALGVFAAALLPRPYGTIISLAILVPCVAYIIHDIMKKGNKWN